MKNTLIVIGAGVAGLTAGCYAQMNGYQTKIIEMADTPGGLCTSWKRNGYTFDGSVAGLAGSRPGSPLYNLWSEIGVIRNCNLFYGENFGFIKLPSGKQITVYTDIHELERHLLEIFPHEKRTIDVFSHALKDVMDVDIPFTDGEGWDAIKSRYAGLKSSISHLPALMKYGKMTIGELAAKTKDPELQTVFRNIVHFGGDDLPLLTVLLPLTYAHRKMAGIPQNGWLSFARAIEKRYLALGGEIQYGEKIARLIIEDNRVKGVRSETGAQYLANRVLSTADGRFSESLLLGKPNGETRHTFDQNWVSDQPTQVNIGAAFDFSFIKGPLTFVLEDALEVAGIPQKRITIHNKFYDQSAAPTGKSAITVFLDSEYHWWKNISGDTKRYKVEKERCAKAVIDIIEKQYPGFEESIEVIDVSTPLTRERFTGNWMGAMQARKPNSNMVKALIQGSPEYEYKGIQGYYMAGQWVESWGGITTAAKSARKAMQLICKKDGQKFIALKEV